MVGNFQPSQSAQMQLCSNVEGGQYRKTLQLVGNARMFAQ